MNKEWMWGIAIVFSVALAVYLGFYLCFVRGFIQIAVAVQQSPIDTLAVIFGIIRICIASVVGWLTVMVSVALSSVLLDIDWRKR